VCYWLRIDHFALVARRESRRCRRLDFERPHRVQWAAMSDSPLTRIGYRSTATRQ
jgi:hypothetical protein